MNTNGDRNGKRVLVTGGTKGIGEAIVNRLRSEGPEVATAARTIPEGIGFPEMLIQADLSTAEGIEHIAVEAQRLLGGVDILINNVGGSSAPSGGALALTNADWQLAFVQNLFAAVRLGRAFFPVMLEQNYGVIIHISSIQRKLPLHDATLAYAAAKAA